MGAAHPPFRSNPMTFTHRSLTKRLFCRALSPAKREPRPFRRTPPAARIDLEQLEDRSLLSVTINVDAALHQQPINPNIHGVTVASTGPLNDLHATLNR